MFDTKRFPPIWEPTLASDELRTLHESILGLFSGDAPGLYRVLRFGADCDLETFVPNASLQDRVYKMLTALENLGQVVYLIQIILDKRPGHPVLSGLLQKWPTPPSVVPPRGQDAAGAAYPVPPMGGNGTAGHGPRANTGEPGDDQDGDDVGGGDPWQVVLLPTRRPFLDRTDFRTTCRRVGLSVTNRILSVTGPSETGKSYTAEYLRGVESLSNGRPQLYLTRRIDLDRLYGVIQSEPDVDERSPLEVDGLRLAKRLALALTDEPLPSHIVDSIGSEQAATWAADTAFSIVSNAKQDPPRWLILDGFDETVLSPHAKELVNSVLDEIATSGGSARVAILGYPGDLSWLPGVQPVVLDLADFRDEEKLTDHVVNFLLEVRAEAEKHERPPYSEADLLRDARTTLSMVNPAAPDLHALEAALTGVAERVLVGV